VTAVRSVAPAAGGEAPVDGLLLSLWLGLLGLGLVAVTSASTELAVRDFGDPWHHLVRHGLYLMVAIVAFGCVLAVPTRFWRRLGAPAYFLTLLLLLLVLVPGIGREANGSLRWVAFGPLSFQPSEAAKFLLVIYLAHYLCRRREEVCGSFVGMVRPLGWLLIPAMLLLAEPDLGATVVIFGAAAATLLLSGARLRDFSLLVLLGASALGAALLSDSERIRRLNAFLDPWEVRYADGYQLTQALIAFGRGEWFGVGLGEGLQKLFYLPEAHTDFIVAVIAEELGAVAVLALCAALATIVVRGLRHGRRAELRGDAFAARLAYCAALMLGVQTLVSLGVNTGLLPTKGLTLPFVSYGGNSLIASCALLALLVRVDFENRIAAPPRRRRELRA
jgi:cell division protein FtsW